MSLIPRPKICRPGARGSTDPPPSLESQGPVTLGRPSVCPQKKSCQRLSHPGSRRASPLLGTLAEGGAPFPDTVGAVEYPGAPDFQGPPRPPCGWEGAPSSDTCAEVGWHVDGGSPPGKDWGIGNPLCLSSSRRTPVPSTSHDQTIKHPPRSPHDQSDTPWISHQRVSPRDQPVSQGCYTLHRAQVSSSGEGAGRPPLR